MPPGSSSLMDNQPLRRSRTQSLPTGVAPSQQEPFKRFKSPLHVSCEADEEVEDNFEADDEISTRNSSRRPSTVAKEEIAQARRLNNEIISSNSKSKSENAAIDARGGSKESVSSNRSNSLFGTMYSIGGSFWNFIRGNPTHTKSIFSNSPVCF